MNPKPVPPMPGGEYVHQAEPETPPLPPGVKRVGLIAVGDGGPGLPLPPSRPPKKPKPLPASREIARLPLRARVAFAARCARRVLPMVRVWKQAPEGMFEHCEKCVRSAERAAATGGPAGDALAAAAYVAAYAAYARREGAQPDGAEGAARAAAERVRDHSEPFDGVAATRNTVLDAGTAILVRSRPDELRFIRRDFRRLRRLARKGEWTDDTPVPPEVFGLLWYDGWRPLWACGPDGPCG